MPTYERNGHQVSTTEGSRVDRRLSRLKSWTLVDETPTVPPPGADDTTGDDDGAGETDGDDTERIVGRFTDVVDDARRMAGLDDAVDTRTVDEPGDLPPFESYADQPTDA